MGVPAGRLIQPLIEAEVALILGADLDGPDLTEEHVRAAVAEVVAALEIVDSRIAGWDITLVDTVSDNASAVYSSWAKTVGRSAISTSGLCG